MHVRPDNPLIVQGDRSVLLETRHPRYEESRDFLARFAELETSPEALHTYRISPISLWNAACAGMKKEEIVEGLQGLSKFPIPPEVTEEISSTLERYGMVRLERHPQEPDEKLLVVLAKPFLGKMLERTSTAGPLLRRDPDKSWVIKLGDRGMFKLRCLKEGWPVEDLAGFSKGEALTVRHRSAMLGNGKAFSVRSYQQEAASRWYMDGSPSGGHGVVVLPCGAGKTIVAMEAMRLAQTRTLILATNAASVDQWIKEILDKTELREDQVGAYMGSRKEIRQVTVATYQILTWRKSAKADFAHLHLFSEHDWGMLIYDEVHLLPAPVFGATAKLQSCRRLGLTATLVREDGREGEVFSLVGPKRYDLPWQTLEQDGFIAEAVCKEIRIPFSRRQQDRYERSSNQAKFRVASLNPAKAGVVRELVSEHRRDNILVIGTYLEQLKELSRQLKAPLITGKTPHRERVQLFERFRTGELNLLIVSKVANFSIDLPDANVAIQISGSFGSRQEEAQRLGRVLRPKKDGGKAWFYTLVTADTKEVEFAMKRQLFLTEQGYRYQVDDRSLVTETSS